MLLKAKDPETAAMYTATGADMGVLSNRISWFYNWKGPSMTVQTACSSSLVGLDLGCQALRNGEANMSVVLGCSLIFTPELALFLSNMGFLSADNKCHSFDATGNGYARAEGFGCLVVKRLDDAVRDGNTVRAVIRSSGTNQDGFTPGLTQPSGASQLKLIQDTYMKAGLDFKSTRFCEAHGTGTALGDPIEAHAIGSAFRSERSTDDPLYM
jgi:acyl transferase domain-containing protein